MGAMGIKHEDGSPFARAVRELTALAYHVVPIIPPDASHPAAGKAPGKFTAGEWRGLGEWERFRDRAPTEFELTLWSANYPDANIGVVCGSPAGDGLVVIAVDIDTNDFEEIDILLGALPHAVMSKKGAKGQTLFYRAPADIKSKSYDLGVRPHARRVLDLLTGTQTRQTVAPPSNHVSGAVYRWLSGPAPAHDLTVFDETALEKLEDTLASLGWNPEAMRATRAANPSRTPLDPDDIWSETKGAALVRLIDWAPHLGLYNLRRARAGFEAVATWRDSSTGRPLEERKRNLSIQPTGIKDFGTGETFSPLDLVMRALGCDLETATTWLRARLGFDDAPVMVLAPARASASEVLMLPQVAPSVVAPLSVVPAPVNDGEMPLHLTRTTGLLGTITDWILATSRRPMPALALAAAVATVSAAAGRRYAGPTDAGTHLYILGTAPTGAGKEHPRAAVARLLSAAGLTPRVGPGRLMSMSAVINLIIRKPITIAVFDEMGGFMKAITNPRASTHEASITEVIRTLWGISFDMYLPPEWAGRHEDPVYSPALCLLGVSTQTEFFAAIGSKDIANGWLNRFLYFGTEIRPRDRTPMMRKQDVPDAIICGLHGVAFPPNMAAENRSLYLSSAPTARVDRPEIVVPWASEAAEQYSVAFSRSIEDRELELLSRTNEIALRLATLKAIGDDPVSPKIRLEDIEWACAIALWSGERMISDSDSYMNESKNQEIANAILRFVRDKGGRAKKSDFVKAKKNLYSRKEIQDVESGLVESEQLCVALASPSSRGGRPTPWYSLPTEEKF